VNLDEFIRVFLSCYLFHLRLLLRVSFTLFEVSSITVPVHLTALGEDFLFHLVAPAIVHITDINDDGDICAGTDVVFDQHHILTCAHVVNDMTVDQQQSFQGVECSID